jgi:hypothetical protein
MLGAGGLIFLGIFIPFQKVTLIFIIIFQTLYSLPVWSKSKEINTKRKTRDQ